MEVDRSAAERIFRWLVCWHLLAESIAGLNTICMLIGALATIGLALTGTLQMRVSRSPIELGVMVHDVGEAEM